MQRLGVSALDNERRRGSPVGQPALQEIQAAEEEVVASVCSSSSVAAAAQPHPQAAQTGTDWLHKTLPTPTMAFFFCFFFLTPTFLPATKWKPQCDWNLLAETLWSEKKRRKKKEVDSLQLPLRRPLDFYWEEGSSAALQE